LAYSGVGIGDLAIIERSSIQTRVGRRWHIGLVGIVQVHPDKSWTREMHVQPALDFADYDTGWPLQRLSMLVFVRAWKVVIDIKSAVKARREPVAV
jgi:hypothetical protein